MPKIRIFHFLRKELWLMKNMKNKKAFNFFKKGSWGFFGTLFLFLVSLLPSLSYGVEINLPYRPLNICYISLNNEKEMKLTQQFVRKIEKALNIQGYIKVHEFQKQGSQPGESFRALLDSGTRCDGLVISGHHTGAFGGKRASEGLYLEELERLSCDPKYSEWFTQVQSLWLQGCRTLGALKEARDQNQNLAEFHADRVYQVREEDHLDQNELQLQEEFASLLDVESPYSFRFFKTFPQSKVFGWTKTAPGERAGSERSLLFHIANTARRIHAQNGVPYRGLQDPVKTRYFNKMSATSYFNALVETLTGNAGHSLESVLKGWVDHGKFPDPAAALWGFANMDLEAYPPAMASNDKEMMESKKLECRLQNANNSSELVSILDSILKNRRSIALSFYTLRDVYRNQSHNVFISRAFSKALMSSSEFIDFIKDKLFSRHIGMTQKMRYYGFFTELTGEGIPDFWEKLERDIKSFLKRPLSEFNTNDSYEVIDMKSTVIEELFKNNLIDQSQLIQLIQASADSSLMLAIIRALEATNDHDSDFQIEPILTAILNHEKIDDHVRRKLLLSLNSSSLLNSQKEKILLDIYNKNILPFLEETSDTSFKLTEQRFTQRYREKKGLIKGILYILETHHFR